MILGRAKPFPAHIIIHRPFQSLILRLRASIPSFGGKSSLGTTKKQDSISKACETRSDMKRLSQTQPIEENMTIGTVFMPHTPSNTPSMTVEMLGRPKRTTIDRSRGEVNRCTRMHRWSQPAGWNREKPLLNIDRDGGGD